MNDMTYISAAQMREADRRCIEDIGIPAAVLMNNAGAAIAEHVDQGPVGIVCGKGNNGGDGYVVARYALLAGLETRVVILAEREDIGGDALVFLRAYENLGGTVHFAPDEDAAASAVGALSDCAVLVDAILGTGSTGEIHGVPRAAIDAWPDVWTIAVDIPSGMNSETGEPCGTCIVADITVAIQRPKRGFATASARPYLGEVVVADIGIPDLCLEDARWQQIRAAK